MRVLIVEDEERLARLLQRVLGEERHTADIAGRGSQGLDMALGGSYDLVILDGMLPDLDGMEVCRRLRSYGITTPVLMLTARAAVEDRVAGLNAGADDYLPKPFAMSELMARVAALLRRAERAPEVQTQLQIDDLTLDMVRHQVRRGDRQIELTPKEFALLEFLMRNRGMALSRTQILDRVWESEADTVSNVVDIYIHYLRDKIDRGSPRPLIRTVRGVGYRMGE